MTGLDHFSMAEEAAAIIRTHDGPDPSVACVLGSGLAGLADAVTDPMLIPYEEIPHFPRPTVAGHHGNMILGRVGGVPVAFLQGRFHYYEGHTLETAAFPVRVLARLGVEVLILTAATGGIAPHLAPGDLVLVTDHLNLLGANPLRGPNNERFGPRFPDMSTVYDVELRAIAEEEAAVLGHSLKPGVYAALSGPSYETPAEIRMLRTLGADVVGMSTVPEAIVARHMGLRVLAFALVTNAAAGVGQTPISHAEVLERGAEAGGRLGRIIERVIGRLRR
jgi:purine-nucleoside phosphorylase